MTTEEKPKLKSCPFCGGQVILERVLRDGYQNCQDDPDAWAYYVVCICCATTGPWRKNESGAARYWNIRIIDVEEKQKVVVLLEEIASILEESNFFSRVTIMNIINNRLAKYPVISGKMGIDLKIKIREEG